MNRTIEQWQKVAETRFHGRVLDQAIEDMQELARQRDELLRMLNGVDDAELLDVLGCENFNRYMDISKGNA